MPVVIDLHGYGEGADSHALTTRFEDVGGTEDFVTVTPEAIGYVPAWDLSRTGRDVVFVADVLEDVESDLCIDEQRVYVTGHSMGAMLLSVLACSTFSTRVAAWAPVAGLRDVPGCATTGEPVMVSHGTDDRTVYYGGGLSDAASQLLFLPADGPPIPVLTAAWAARNGCGNAIPSIQELDGITEQSYPCDVVLRTIDHGPHVWPPGATGVIWDFFAAHRS
ncbi:MAG: polyhydroxybutyrate depolymerase [Actinomycetota bacterium]|jgi:polyhydroxybutyrate depolymerase|nr:polyhydroxybutyrate depolymerase [Actinomycetota bacterium]